MTYHAHMLRRTITKPLADSRAKQSLRSLHEVLQSNATYEEFQKEVAKISKRETPYGPIACKMELPCEGEEPLVWHFCNPFALLYAICESCPAWSKFIQKCLGGRSGGLILYTDECTPGNALHPFNQREFTGIYYTIDKLPSWFRARKYGWLAVGYISTPKLKLVRGQLPGMCRHVLRYLYNPNGFSLSVGMLLPATTVLEKRFKLKLNLLCFMQDGKAHKVLSSTKGAGGMKCCSDCKNVGNFVDGHDQPLEGHPYLQHYALAVPSQFDLHTSASFFEMADKLADQHGKIGKGKFEDLQKHYGLNYDPDGMNYDKYLRSIYNPIDKTYWDPMHVLLQGGVAQYELNAFLYKAGELGVSLESVDVWISEIHWPSGITTGPTGPKVLHLCVGRGSVLIEYEMCSTHNFFLKGAISKHVPFIFPVFPCRPCVSRQAQSFYIVCWPWLCPGLNMRCS